MPDCAIFSDTGAEPRKVYEWLAWLETQLPFPVHHVSAGSLLETVLSRGPQRFVQAPFFTKFSGEIGMTRRQCTREFKIEPIGKKIRELIGLVPRQRAPKTVAVRQIIGISLDEIHRIKVSDQPYIEYVYPLIERRMTRMHCLDWMRAHGYPEPPKSACTFCPYHDSALWRDMKLNDPESFAQAVEMDRHIRTPGATVNRQMNGELYVHRSCKPLEEVDFSSAEDMGQLNLWGFGNECDGMCGV